MYSYFGPSVEVVEGYRFGGRVGGSGRLTVRTIDSLRTDDVL
ncbi:hypothetical protein [Halobium salinum]|nr:hypothetical protein [Halobium salinum]